MAYYRDHAHEGRDEASLADLRRRCAGIVSGKLGIEVTAGELVDAIRFRRLSGHRPGTARAS